MVQSKNILDGNLAVRWKVHTIEWKHHKSSVAICCLVSLGLGRIPYSGEFSRTMHQTIFLKPLKHDSLLKIISLKAVDINTQDWPIPKVYIYIRNKITPEKLPGCGGEKEQETMKGKQEHETLNKEGKLTCLYLRVEKLLLRLFFSDF